MPWGHLKIIRRGWAHEQLFRQAKRERRPALRQLLCGRCLHGMHAQGRERLNHSSSVFSITRLSYCNLVLLTPPEHVAWQTAAFS